MAGETLDFQVTVDAAQAQTEIAKFTGRISELEGKLKTSDAAVDAMKQSLSEMTAQLAATQKVALEFGKVAPISEPLGKAAKAANEAKTGLAAFQDQAKTAQAKLAPAAAAISGIASAFGATNGEAGKAFAAIGQVTAAFAAGGPFGAALSAGVFAVDMLTQAWEKEIKAQDEALKKTYQAIDDQVKVTETLRKQAEELRAKSTPLGASEIRSRANEEIRQLGIRIWANQSLARDDKQRADSLLAQNKQLEAQQRYIYEIAEFRAQEAEKAEKDARDRESAERKRQEEERQRQEESLRQQQKSLADAYKARLQLIKDFNEEVEKINLDRMGMSLAVPGIQGQVAGQTARTDIIGGKPSELQALSLEAEKNAAIAQDWSLAWKQAGKDVESSFGGVAGALSGAFSVAVQGAQQYVSDLVTGQEKASERLAALVMGQAGQSLIASGTDLAGKAIVSALSGAAPVAAAQGAAAAGLVGTGLALGGAATGIEHLLAGGKIGKPLPDKSSARERGASSFSGRSSRGDGGTNLTIVYGGISGPTADQGSRALMSAWSRARRRGYA
jgi:chromosome segregation ATPase